MVALYKNKLYHTIAKWYLYLLPIRMCVPFTFLTELLPGAAAYFDFLLHCIGLFLMINTSCGVTISSNKLFRTYRNVFIWFNLSSILMAFIMHFRFGPFPKETSFEAVIGPIIYVTQFIFILYYNIRVFSLFTLSEIDKIIGTVCTYLLFIGYFQILIILISPLQSLYDIISASGVLADSSMVMRKLPLTSTEGAGAGSVIGAFILPYLLSKFYSTKDKKILFTILAWLPVIYFTHSSTCYLLTIIAIIVFLLFTTRHFFNIIIPVVLIIAAVVVLVSYLPEEERNILYYMVFQKAGSAENASTASRYAPIFMDWAAFLDNPIFGCGNGLQGYYHNAIPDYLLAVEGTDLNSFLDEASGRIMNGGVHWPSFLSGYGVIGVFLMYIVFKRSIMMVKKNRAILGHFYLMFMISIIVLFLDGVQGDFWGRYDIWFVYSIPFLVNCRSTVDGFVKK